MLIQTLPSHQGPGSQFSKAAALSVVNCFWPKETPASLLAVVSMTKRYPKAPKCKDKEQGQGPRPSYKVRGVALRMEPQDHGERLRLSMQPQTTGRFKVFRDAM